MSKPEVADLDALMVAEKNSHPILSDIEVAAAKKEARDAVEKERKSTAIKTLIAQETLRLRREEGLVSGDPVKDEMVQVTIDLPEFCSDITINMEPFYHSHTYRVPRHVANSMKEQMQRAWMHQNEIDGKSQAQDLLSRREVKLTPLNADAVVRQAQKAFA